MKNNLEYVFEKVPFGISLNEFKEYIIHLCEEDGRLHCKHLSVYKTANIYKIQVFNVKDYKSISFYFKDDILRSIKAVIGISKKDNPDMVFSKFIKTFQEEHNLSDFKIMNENMIIKDNVELETIDTHLELSINDGEINIIIKKLRFS